MKKLSDDWIIGFCDGEAAFQVLIDKREKGFYVENRFTIGLEGKEKGLLEEIRAYFGVGEMVYRNMEYVRQQGIGSKDQWHYVVRGPKECSVIDKFFKNNSLQSSKQGNFQIWSKILDMVKCGRHRQIAGILEIAKLRDQMQVKTRDYRYRNYQWFLKHYCLEKEKLC